MSGKVNCLNVRTWDTRNPHEIVEHVRYSPNVCAVKFHESIWSFLLRRTNCNWHYLDILENYLMPQLQQDMDREFIFQQDGATPHFHREVTS
jgi:hypothetical protein